MITLFWLVGACLLVALAGLQRHVAMVWLVLGLACLVVAAGVWIETSISQRIAGGAVGSDGRPAGALTWRSPAQ